MFKILNITLIIKKERKREKERTTLKQSNRHFERIYTLANETQIKATSAKKNRSYSVTE